ncbi:hypothetical protein PROPHIGD05-3_37 [Mycobacterium phage prophiGD05-3]|nr:hypothetical protein PROPHIGD05-3_37 [Mycobacterium phage prophiGD05-3]
MLRDRDHYPRRHFVSADEPTREEVATRWLKMAPGIEAMTERIADPRDFPVEPGSPLFGDDKASDPYLVSLAARACLMIGVDHLDAAKSLVLDLKVLHISAAYTLVRGALENLAAAFWILNPSQRNDRIEHTLRWHAKDLREQGIAMKSRGMLDDSDYHSKLARLHAVAAPRDIPNQIVDAGFRSSTAIKYASGEFPDYEVLLSWQVCSGFAHGRPWAVLALSERELYETAVPGVMGVRVVSNPGRLTGAATCAFNLLVAVVDVLQQRSLAPA